MSASDELQLHHIGYLVKDLVVAQQHWEQAYGYHAHGQTIQDVGQQARVLLLRKRSERHWIELISPDSEQSHLHGALQRKVSLHHVAYQVEDMMSSAQSLRAAGGLPLSKPVIGAAFQRTIMWFHDPLKGLVELIAAGEGPYQLD
ncbi:VOC family protein [Cerasicoccus frondis]|uniref:VOC family protein n=1 Tax=Cerasicoccus frondis TaxID=490090 RepID=UPI0028529A9C|nr:VOC family protein [Cerasicoccus frondis]